MIFKETPEYNYSDVFIVPQYSSVTSRKNVDTSVVLSKALKLDVPVMSSNMDTITESSMARAMWGSGAIGALHRFMSVEDNVRTYLESPKSTFVSIGVNDDSEERFTALHKAGARNFIIDVANGHSSQMKKAVTRLRSRLSNVKDPIFIMAGNVATTAGATFLADLGVDAIKVGIGPGRVCTTKNVTGVTFPQFSAVVNCAAIKPLYPDVKIIADGGIVEIGDIAKALAVGADAAMCGRLFAACVETPSIMINDKKVYRGSASIGTMRRIKAEDMLPTPEGISIQIEDPITSAEVVVNHIRGGLQSSFSYCNATNISEFRKNAVIGVRWTP